MKSMAAVLCITVCSMIAVGQRKLAEDDPQWRQQTVDRAFQEVTSGMRTSWSEKYLARLGDSAAPEIISYLRSRHLTNQDTVTALSLVKMSFADPSLIRNDSNKIPKNSLILLDYLDKHTTDADTKSKINAARDELQSATIGTKGEHQ
jgi:hypothetical protein